MEERRGGGEREEGRGVAGGERGERGIIFNSKTKIFPQHQNNLQSVNTEGKDLPIPGNRSLIKLRNKGSSSSTCTHRKNERNEDSPSKTYLV